ncbi:MAG TPA: GGDEF domain-containing protein [Thermoanaerobaculia bacterium]
MLPLWAGILLAAAALLGAGAAARERRRAAHLAERLAARERETHLLSESPNPETILRRAYEAASERLPISRFDLYTIDDAGRVEDAWTLSGEPGRRVPRRDEGSRWRGLTVDAPRVKDLTATETGLSFAPRDLLAGGPATKRLQLPLFSGDRLVAHLVLESPAPIDDGAKAEIRALLAPLTAALHGSRNWRIAVTDELSGLASRRYFETRLAEEWARQERYGAPLAVAILDLDHFKGINDTYGHPAGDRVLSRFGEIVRGEIRSSDVACRYGGEEFAILFAESTAAAASAVAERVRRALKRDAFASEGRTFHATVSAGVAGAEDAKEPATLLYRADEALYRAKGGGRNRVVVWPDTARRRSARP